MNTDHLDLWQVHDVRTEADVAAIFEPGGAIEAFAKAKEKGLTRFIGVTGHHDPSILKRCIEIYDFDTVLMPVNPAEPAHASFIDTVLPVAHEKNMGIVAMKVYFRGLAARVPGFESMAPYFRYSLSHPVSTAVIGCNDTQQLEENVQLATSFKPMNHDEMQALVNHIAPLCKTTHVLQAVIAPVLDEK